MSERLRTYVHDVRRVGNVAAHEEKETAGGVIDVEPGEAEWLLELLQVAFEDYYVTPARDAARRAELDKKIGKA